MLYVHRMCLQGFLLYTHVCDGLWLRRGLMCIHSLHGIHIQFAGVNAQYDEAFYKCRDNTCETYTMEYDTTYLCCNLCIQTSTDLCTP